MTDKEYLLHGGGKCPACTSTDISSDHLEADGPSATAKVECHECGATWYDNYALIGYTNLEKGEPA